MSESDSFWLILFGFIGLLIYSIRLTIKHGIAAEFKLTADKQLEELKSDLTSKIEGTRHEYELAQLQTSLLFDHKRIAFATLLARIAEVDREWFKSAYEPHTGILSQVPSDQYKKLGDAYIEHQLFFDGDCLAAIDLVLNTLRGSFPFEDGEGNIHTRDCDAAYRQLEYLQPRVAEIFQGKLGFQGSDRGKEDVALLGAILLLNHYHFRDIGLPVKGNLKLDAQDFPGEAVAKAEANKPELLHKLREFDEYLRKGHGVFHEAATSISRYIEMLEAD